MSYGHAESFEKYERKRHEETDDAGGCVRGPGGLRRDSPAGAPASGLGADRVAEPQRDLALRVRQGGRRRGREVVRRGQREVRPLHRRALPVGERAFRHKGRGGHRLVPARGDGAGGLEGEARLPRRWRERPRYDGVVRRRPARRAHGRLHAVRVRADGPREVGRGAADHAARVGRVRRAGGFELAALRQAGIRQRARRVADGLPGGARKRVPGDGPSRRGRCARR